MFKEYGGDHKQVMNVFLTAYLFLDVQGVWREQVMNVFLTVYLFVDVLTAYLFVDVQGVWR